MSDVVVACPICASVVSGCALCRGDLLPVALAVEARLIGLDRSPRWINAGQGWDEAVRNFSAWEKDVFALRQRHGLVK